MAPYSLYNYGLWYLKDELCGDSKWGLHRDYMGIVEGYIGAMGNLRFFINRNALRMLLKYMEN